MKVYLTNNEVLECWIHFWTCQGLPQRSTSTAVTIAVIEYACQYQVDLCLRLMAARPIGSIGGKIVSLKTKAAPFPG
ncbi:hypothetical protein ACD661_11245 [Legionella lytica]|uniref:Uncharacterized protein n=1 Tax=Legionella lytica TaxID=96232 RepID=A0ABW8D8U8_9GAMM